MPRNRMIKPEFWEDYKFAECSSNARLLFLAMLNFADDEGFLEHNCRWLKVKCLPYDSVKIEPLLDELLKIERIAIKNNIIWIKNFLKHQRIDKPNKSNLSQIFNDSTNDRRIINEQSTTKDKIKEDKLSEVKLSEITKVSGDATAQYGNIKINDLLGLLREKVGVDDFKESIKYQRIWGKNLVSLMEKVSPHEFGRRLELLLADTFMRKNCNKLEYIYREIKGFIEPKNITVKI